MLRRALGRLARLLGGRGREGELDEELRFHLEQDAARHRARGLSDEEARLAAVRAFGNVGSLKESVRDTWRFAALADLSRDVRHAWRGILRAPGFAFTVIATIALALGLNTTVFTVFDTYVLRQIPVRDPGQLYELTLTNRTPSRFAQRFSWARYQDLRNHNAAFSELFAYRFLVARLLGQSVVGEAVSGNYFHLLGVGATRGRTIEPTDDLAPGASPVVVLSHDAWRTKFGSDPSIVGRHMRLNGVELQVIGVASFTGEQLPVDFWVPLSELGLLNREMDLYGPGATGWVGAIGRLRPQVSTSQASERLTQWARTATGDSTERAVLWSRATPLVLTPDVIAALSPIFVAFGLVLLIACANVANMMLARGMTRQREIGIRLSLGAARGRLVRQLLTEAVILAAPAAALGFLLSRFTIRGSVQLLYASIPGQFAQMLRVLPMTPDLRVFGFMLAAALTTALLFGLVPALQATRPRVVQATRGDLDVTPQASRLRTALVIGQIAVSALLVITAGVLLRSARRMRFLDPGIRTSGALEITVQEPFRHLVLTRLRERPDVMSLASATTPPLGGIFPGSVFAAASAPGTVSRGGGYNFVSPAYFQTFGIRVLRGRTFTDTEAQVGAPVAVVSEGAARILWPGRDPLGARLYVALDAASLAASPLRRFREATVIGVASDAVGGYIGLSLDWPVVYYPTSLEVGGTTLLARVRGDVARERVVLDRDLAAADSGAVEQIQTTEESRAVQIYPFRVASWVSQALGAVALLLTVTGVYGVLAYLVARRTREIGVRMAIGATTREVITLVLRQVSRLACVGIGVGVALGLAISWLAAAELSNVTAFDPWGYVGGVATVLAACLAAAIVPAYRAGAVDPVTALRCD